MDKCHYISGQMYNTMKKPKKPQSLRASEPGVSYKKPGEGTSVHEILDVQINRVSEPLQRVETFRAGFRKRTFERLKEITGLDNNTLAMVLSISAKTIQRKQVFDVVQSEKMFELAELYSIGINYFGMQGFRQWMERPLFTLGNRRPIELLDVSEGITLLKTEIMRLQHGVAV
jgi:putative toxin-antitoxin system antitoxin component (TIGR02293 family)